MEYGEKAKKFFELVPRESSKYNNKEIAQIFGISEMRVAQIHTAAMLRIRGKLQSLDEAARPGS